METGLKRIINVAGDFADIIIINKINIQIGKIEKATESTPSDCVQSVQE